MKNLIAKVKKIPPKLIGLIFFVLIVIFFFFYLRSIDWHTVKHLRLDWLNIGLATFFALIFRYLSVFVWRTILVDLGAKKMPKFRILSDVYAKAWLGRYIPGTVAWLAGKVYMASSHGISKSRLAVSSLLEGGMQVVAILAVATILLGFDPRIRVLPFKLKLLLMAVSVILLLILNPKVFNYLMEIGFKILGRKQPSAEMKINARAVMSSFVLYAVGGFVIGLSEFFITRAIVPTLPWHDFLFIIGAYNLAGAIGILAIFVPSGIGVKDGIQLVLLSLILPREVALIVTVTSRLWAAVVDVLFYLIAGNFRRLFRSKE